MDEETTARSVDEVEDLHEAVVAPIPRIRYVSIPWVVERECRVERAEANDSVVERRIGAVAQIALVALIHGENEVIERRVSRQESAGSRREFNPASSRFRSRPFIGQFSTVPPCSSGAMDLNARRKPRLVDEGSHDSLGGW